MGQSKALEITKGKEYIKEYRAIRDKATHELCGNIRYFCGECGSHLYAYDKKYADYVYPFASAIDTPLPELENTEIYHIMLGSKANWVPAPKHNKFNEYPDCSLEQWHKNNNKYFD
ncbi:putative glutathione-dependent formaldehyde-activating enzyme [Choanephora cucurbitarum]|uniref:Putative glutathione-dependent formaldehyde-activating enzyme n=1 Tax=Choanephora cucurbitarum TaxID=101091 RepID=A0A1C7MW98_9FUNG|nr:putative glutathione-dependent formaldehyde-activating enzyme [Choanephora cucurbitarum]